MNTRITLLFILSVASATVLPNAALAQKVLVVYYSVDGHTELMAKAVASGAEAVTGAEVRLRILEDASSEDLLWADAILVGSPVYASNIAAPVVEFLAAMPWGDQLKDKIGGAFVTAGGISAGEEFAQLAILRMMLISTDEREKAEALAERIEYNELTIYPVLPFNCAQGIRA